MQELRVYWHVKREKEGAVAATQLVIVPAPHNLYTPRRTATGNYRTALAATVAASHNSSYTATGTAPHTGNAPRRTGYRTPHLNEDERPDEDVGGLDVLLEGGNVLRVAQLLQKVADALHAHVVPALVDRLARLRQGALVLRLQHHVRHLKQARGREGGRGSENKTAANVMLLS